MSIQQFFSISVCLILGCFHGMTFAQSCHNSHGKLDSALAIVSKQMLHFESICGSNNEEVIPVDACIVQTYAFIWLTWKIEGGGDFYFKITPNDSTVDFDFAVYGVSGIGQQQELKIIRCMTSGESGGRPDIDNTPCLGETGLSPNETDTIEYPGCDAGSNNFISALECEKGDRYALLISDFSLSGQGFTIEFCGSAVLGPSDEPCFDQSTSTQNIQLPSPIRVSPNPSPLGKIKLTLPERISSIAQIMLRHSSGQIFQIKDSHCVGGIIDVDLGGTSLKSGFYFITLIIDNHHFHSKFVLID